MTEVMMNLGFFELASMNTGLFTLAEDTWQDYFNFFDFSKGVDTVMYAWMAVGGTIVFFLRLVSMLFLGDILGGVDADADVDVGDTGGFTVFSLFSIVSFFMGTGWMGLLCIYEYEFGTLMTSITSFLFGSFCLMLSASMLFYLKKLDASPKMDYETAMGKLASVYMTIPAKGEGRGEVEVVVSGKKKILEASSSGDAIPAFKSVRVTEVRDDKSVVVEVVE